MGPRGRCLGRGGGGQEEAAEGQYGAQVEGQKKRGGGGRQVGAEGEEAFMQTSE